MSSSGTLEAGHESPLLDAKDQARSWGSTARSSAFRLCTVHAFRRRNTGLRYLADFDNGLRAGAIGGVVIATVHFLLPMAIAYTVSTNSHLSRPLILVYAMTLAASLYFGFGYVAPVVDGKFAPSLAMLLSLAAVVAWLFGSPKMRIYYALLRDRPLPKRLAERAIEHVEEPWPGRRAAGVLEWLSEHLETVVLIGLIVTVHLACVSMDPY